MAFSSTYKFLGGANELQDKIDKVEQMLDRASDSLMKAQGANETIYRRAYKEALTQVLLVLKED